MRPDPGLGGDDPGDHQDDEGSARQRSTEPHDDFVLVRLTLFCSNVMNKYDQQECFINQDLECVIVHKRCCTITVECSPAWKVLLLLTHCSLGDHTDQWSMISDQL